MAPSWSPPPWPPGRSAGCGHGGAFGAALVGILVGVALAYATYFITVRPIQTSRRIAEAEKEIFILTATLLLGIIIQEAIRLSLHQQCQDRPAADRRRGDFPRRAHAGQ
ncbi:MAG: hypothetical protein WDN69_37795 [Aliidongia sp.]